MMGALVATVAAIAVTQLGDHPILRITAGALLLIAGVLALDRPPKPNGSAAPSATACSPQ